MCYLFTQRFSLVIIFIVVLNIRQHFGRKHDNKVTTTSKPLLKTTTRTSETTTKAVTGKAGVEKQANTTSKLGVTVPPEVPTHTYLGFGAGKHWWLSNDKYAQSDAAQGCKDILNYLNDQKLEPFTHWAFYLAVGEDDNERTQITRFMSQASENTAWLGSITKPDEEGKSILIEPNSFGVTIQNAHVLETRQKPKNAKVVSKPSKNRRKTRNRKYKRDLELRTRPTSINFEVTHYPWLSSWNVQGRCNDIRACEPVKCEVTTPPCDLGEQVCKVQNGTQCAQISSGNCSAVCERCEISHSAECWVAESKCEVVKERQCQIQPPDCEVETPQCTVLRPACVTKSAPCTVKEATFAENKTVCETSEICAKSQGVICTTEFRICTSEEVEENITECKNRKCVPNPICIKPDICRPTGNKPFTVHCPPPVTFCPPETIHCPSPNVTCSEPGLTCTDPQIYCAPPQIVCTQPQVTCSTPKISCPNVVAECTNPEVDCDDLDVDCPPPVMKCSEPPPCLIKPPTSTDMCSVKCEGPKCKCQIFKQTVEGQWGQAPENCDAQYRGLCAGHERLP